MYTIRPYAPADSGAVERVCVSLADPVWQKTPLFREALLAVYCRWYLENTPGCCFVAENGAGEVQGYVLCAPDYEFYKEHFPAVYRKTLNPVIKGMGKNAVDSIAPFCADYPAHLHIDLLPQMQGQGAGRALIEALCAALQAKGVPGVLLDVAIDNTGAQAFYKKCGFTLLQQGKQEIIYGKKLQ